MLRELAAEGQPASFPLCLLIWEVGKESQQKFPIFSFDIREFNLEVQQNIVALRAIRGEMFIEQHQSVSGTISASFRVQSIIYKHCGSSGAKRIPLVH
jgi:hypothetical protein